MTAAIATRKALPKRPRRQKKAAPEFTRYSESEWSEIKQRATAAWGVFSDDMVGLRDTLERLGREYASLSKDKDQRKRFVSKGNHAAKFRLQMMTEPRLPPELQQRATEVAGEIERFCQVQLAYQKNELSRISLW